MNCNYVSWSLLLSICSIVRRNQRNWYPSHTYNTHHISTYVCVLLSVFIVFSHYYLCIIFFAICRCYFITYVVFIRPVQLWKPKVNICRRSLRLLILLDQLSNQINIEYYASSMTIGQNWWMAMKERGRERFVARSHSHSCQCSVECITNFLLFRSMKSLNSGESAT